MAGNFSLFHFFFLTIWLEIELSKEHKGTEFETPTNWTRFDRGTVNNIPASFIGNAISTRGGREHKKTRNNFSSKRFCLLTFEKNKEAHAAAQVNLSILSFNFFFFII